jgi:peroxiredoxin
MSIEKPRRIAGLILGLALLATPVLAATVGRPAPGFKVTTFDHKVISLADLRGKVVVLNFWATWCGPCRNEMVVMDTYIRTHPGADLRIFAVSTEDSVPDDQLKPLAKVLHFPLVIRLHGGGYDIIDHGVPTSYVIDRAGVLRHAAAGAFDTESFDALITPLLAEPDPALPSPGVQSTTTAFEPPPGPKPPASRPPA